MLSLIKDKHKKWFAVVSFSFEPKEKNPTANNTLYIEMTADGINLQKNENEYIKTIPINDIQATLAQFTKRKQSLKEQRGFRGQGCAGHGRQALLNL